MGFKRPFWARGLNNGLTAIILLLIIPLGLSRGFPLFPRSTGNTGPCGQGVSEDVRLVLARVAREVPGRSLRVTGPCGQGCAEVPEGYWPVWPGVLGRLESPGVLARVARGTREARGYWPVWPGVYSSVQEGPEVPSTHPPRYPPRYPPGTVPTPPRYPPHRTRA